MRKGPDKNPFKSVSDLLSRASPAKANFHFLAYLIDLVLVAVVSYLLFLGGMAIADNNSTYQSYNANYEAEITYYQDMVVEAHLSEYLDRDNHVLADSEDLATKMAISQILMSYSHDNPSSPEFYEDPIEKLKQTYVGSFYSDCFEPISFGNDYVAQFIIDYAPTHNENNELIPYADRTPTEYTIAFYKRHAAKHDKIRLVYTEDNSVIPYLRMDFANSLYKYLVKAEGNTRDAYDTFVSFYSGMLTDCQDRVFKAPSYQNGHYVDYIKNRQAITQVADSILLVAIFVGYYIAVFTPMMIFKDGRSLGKIVLRLGSINIDKSETEWWKVALRSVLTAISNMFIAFFLVLLPPFNGASLILYLPFISIGSFDITLLNISIAIFIIASINGIVMLLSHEKRSLTDQLFKTVTVDVTVLDEPDYDERNEAGI